MASEKFHDIPGGDTVLLQVVDEKTGYRQPVVDMPADDRIEQFKSVADIQCRDNDIFLNSYPKTGTNWMWEMLHLVINKTSIVSGDGKMSGMIEMLPKGAIDGLPSPRLLNTHLKTIYLPKDVVTKKVKVVLICRNPKDVAVSFYNHTKGIRIYGYDGKFENYCEMFMRGDTDYGSYSDYLMEWQQFIREHPDLPVHIVYYEDLKENCFDEMKKVVEFLELDVGLDLLKEICDNCQMSKILEGKRKAMDPEMIKKFETEIMKEGFTVFRKGQIGDWKNWFSSRLNDKFETWWTAETKNLDMFTFRYE